MNYTTHLRISEIRRNTTAIIRNGQHLRLLNGELITEAEFQQRYKLPVRCFISSENPCRKGQYLDV